MAAPAPRPGQRWGAFLCKKQLRSSLLSPPSSSLPPPSLLPRKHCACVGTPTQTPILDFGVWLLRLGFLDLGFGELFRLLFRLGLSSSFSLWGIASARTFITRISITLMGKPEHLESLF